MRTGKTELVLVYDVEHVSALERFLNNRSTTSPEPTVVVLGAEVEMHVRDAHIPFVSARDFRAKDSTHFLLAETWLAFLEQRRWQWFRYQDISLGQLFAPILQDYIRQAIYYVDIITRVCDAQQELSRIVVFPPTQRIPHAGAFIAKRQISLIPDCVRLVGGQRHIEVVVHKLSDTKERVRIQTQWFAVQRVLFSFGLSLLNLCTNVLRPRGTIRILASDYWRNIAPVLEHLSGAEVILCDRKQILNVRLRNAWKYRMRFLSSDSYKARGRSVARCEALDVFQKEWRAAYLPAPDVMNVGNASLKPLLNDVLEEVMYEWLPAILERIDELYALVDTLRPDIVLLRATVSQQWHFPLLALIATARGIPSLELLHGMEYVGPGGIDKRHLAHYLGVYGLHTQRQMHQVGFTKERLPIIGSPRFDLYELKRYAQSRNERVTTDHCVIFCTAPDLFIGGAFDTYDVERYFSSVAKAVRAIPGASVLVKLRPGRYREMFYRRAIAEAFSDIPYTVAQFESLRELFPRADIAVSCQSTVTLEALQCGVPLVLFAATPVEQLMLQHNFADFAAAGAVALCLNAHELAASLAKLSGNVEIRKSMSRATGAFLDREFAFDGQSAQRAAALIRVATGKA